MVTEKDMNDLRTNLYIVFGIIAFLIVVLLIAVIYLLIRVQKLHKQIQKNQIKAAKCESSKELGLQLVEQRFQIPKPSMTGDSFEDTYEEMKNHEFGNKFKPETRFKEELETIPSNLDAFRNPRNDPLGLNENFSFPPSNLRSNFGNKRDQEERKPRKMNKEGNELKNLDPMIDYFPFSPVSRMRSDKRNEREQDDPRSINNMNLPKKSYRNPLSTSSDQDNLSDSNYSFSNPRNVQRNAYY